MFTIYFSPKRILKLTKGSTFLARGEELVEKMRRWRLPFLLAFPSLLGDLDHQHHCEDTTSPELFNAFNNRIMGIGGEEGDKAGYVPFVSHFFTLLSWYTCLFHLPFHFFPPNSKPVPEGGTQTRDIAASMAALARSVHMR